MNLMEIIFKWENPSDFLCKKLIEQKSGKVRFRWPISQYASYPEEIEFYPISTRMKIKI